MLCADGGRCPAELGGRAISKLLAGRDKLPRGAGIDGRRPTVLGAWRSDEAGTVGFLKVVDGMPARSAREIRVELFAGAGVFIEVTDFFRISGFAGGGIIAVS